MEMVVRRWYGVFRFPQRRKGTAIPTARIPSGYSCLEIGGQPLAETW